MSPKSGLIVCPLSDDCLLQLKKSVATVNDKIIFSLFIVVWFFCQLEFRPLEVAMSPLMADNGPVLPNVLFTNDKNKREKHVRQYEC